MCVNTYIHCEARLVKCAIIGINSCAVEISNILLFPSSQLLLHDHMFTNTRRYHQRKQKNKPKNKKKIHKKNNSYSNNSFCD